MTHTALPPRPQAGPADERGPNCWQCRFLGITHLPATPYACQRLGFRSQVLPSLEVLRSDGRFCQGFVPKAAATATGLASGVVAGGAGAGAVAAGRGTGTGTASGAAPSTPASLSASTWSRFV